MQPLAYSADVGITNNEKNQSTNQIIIYHLSSQHLLSHKYKLLEFAKHVNVTHHLY